MGIIFAYVYNGVGKGNSPFYVSTISFTVAFVFAYILSFIVPSKHKKDITGLTILKKINHQHTFQNGYEKVDCYDKTPSLSYDALLRQLGDGVLMLP